MAWELELDETFEEEALDQTRWLPYYLPHWSSRERAAARYELGEGELRLLIEEDQDRLYRQITHELTHIFAFDMIPRSRANVRRVPAWIDEGFAEYMTDVWDPANLRKVRDIVAADRVPRMTTVAGPIVMDGLYGDAHLGHAVFEFIEAEYGKPAVWQFLLEVRRNVVDGAGNPYQVAFNRTPEEFDAAFAQYLRTRFGA